MKFEWDEEKNRANKKKHGISFDYAALVFDDEYYIEDYDSAHSDDEDRYIITGMVDDIICVVCTIGMRIQCGLFRQERQQRAKGDDTNGNG